LIKNDNANNKLHKQSFYKMVPYLNRYCLNNTKSPY